MVDFDILREAGTTNERLREIFTAKVQQGASDEEKKVQKKDERRAKKMQSLIDSRVNEAIQFSLKNHTFYSSVDLAWDSSPINHHIIPLILYAQKRIGLDSCLKQLDDLKCGDQYIKRDQDGRVQGVDLPRFFEVNINLVRSLVTRRLAAQAGRYSNLYPFLKYEPRANSEVGKLRAALLSQRMEIMSDQYGYRHQNVQFMRDMLLYGHCVAFPRASWEREVQWVKRDASLSARNGKLPKKNRVVKEGIAWVNPHPSRVFWDKAYPLASLNSDSGCEFVGFWDVQRFRDLAHNPAYFNREEVGLSTQLKNFYDLYPNYFSQYYTTINPPSAEDIPGLNDRKNSTGYYNGDTRDNSVLVAEFYWKIIPSDWGIGDYPYPVWLHLKLAGGNNKVIFAEFMPSSPAAVYSFNENDSRLVNLSTAHELMPFQDQLTNLYSQLLETAKADLFNVAILNTDVFPDTDDGKAVLKQFKDLMQGRNYYATTHMLEASFRRLGELGIDLKPDNIFKVVRSSPNTQLNTIFGAINELLASAERLMNLSPQEQGQPSPRETSATEVTIINNTTEAVYNYISDATDEAREAIKRITYESLIALGTANIDLPVKDRFPEHVVQAAGLVFTEQSGIITGGKESLVHEYTFSSRDGGERTVNPQQAQALVQLLQVLFQYEPIAQTIGKKKLYELVNEISRRLDAGIDLKLELKPGEDEELAAQPSMKEVVEAIQQNSMSIEQIQQALTQPAPQPQQPQQPQQQPQPVPQQ